MTIHEFAQRIGVSTATVWRAINDSGRIHPDARRMVLRRMRELDYRPNAAARALAVGRTQTIALWMPNLYHPVYSQVIHHIQEHLIGDGYNLIVRDLTPLGRAESPSQRLTRVPADGVIVFDGGNQLQRLLHSASGLKLPMVCMGPYCVDSLDHVEVDLGTGARAAVRHLLSLGRRRVACAMGDLFLPSSADARRDAYVTTMRKAGLAAEFIPVPAPWDRAEAERVILHYAKQYGPPQALFCFNDECAIGAQKALKTLGCRIPEDVALAGCDGIQDTEYTDPPLTTVVQPLDEMCATAWQFLKRRMDSPSLPVQRKVLASRLAIRGS